MKKGIYNSKEIYVLLTAITIVISTISIAEYTNTNQVISYKTFIADLKNTSVENNMNETAWYNESIIRYDEDINEMSIDKNNDLVIEKDKKRVVFIFIIQPP